MKPAEVPFVRRGSPIFRWLLLLVLGGMLLALVLTLVGIALPLSRSLLFMGFSQGMLGGHLESLAVDLDIRPGLKWLFTLLVVLPTGYGLSMMVTFSPSRAARGLALVLGTLLLLTMIAWARTQHFNFDADGRPVVYLSFHRDGVRKSYHPGRDRVTGRDRVPVTAERVAWLSSLCRQPVQRVDPAIATNWFDANSGEPNLWYVEPAPGQWLFFNRPHFHQQMRTETQPVTPELMARWQVGHQRLLAVEATERALRQEATQREAELQARRDRLRLAKAEEDRLREAVVARQRAEERRLAEVQARAEAEARARDDADRQRLADASARAEAETRAKAEVERQRQAAELERQRQLAQRRLRESVALPADLGLWDWVTFAGRVFPQLETGPADAATFADEFQGRRFRFRSRIVAIRKRAGEVEYAALPFGPDTMALVGPPPVDPPRGFKVDREFEYVATISGLGVREGRWILRLDRVVLLPAQPVPVVVAPPPAPPKSSAAQPATPKQPRRKLGDIPVIGLITVPFEIAQGMVMGVTDDWSSRPARPANLPGAQPASLAPNASNSAGVRRYSPSGQPYPTTGVPPNSSGSTY